MVPGIRPPQSTSNDKRSKGLAGRCDTVAPAKPHLRRAQVSLGDCPPTRMEGLLKTRNLQSAFGSTAANLTEAVATGSHVETRLVWKAGILSLIALALGRLRSYATGL